MDRIAEWRPVEPAGPDGSAETTTPAEPAADKTGAQRSNTTSWRLVGPALIALSVAGSAIAGAVALVVLSSMPKPAVAIDSAATARPAASDGAGLVPTASAATIGEIVVDVEGAVEKAGVWRLPADSRVGDAIDAAGGYSAQVDIAAAAKQLNLAQPLVDGQQIHVPVRGEAEPTAAARGSDGGGLVTPSPGAAGGLIDVNSASAEELDTLPGIGPVTAAKIIAARQESPFASVDELVGRGVVGQSTFDKLRALITVTP